MVQSTSQTQERLKKANGRCERFDVRELPDTTSNRQQGAKQPKYVLASNWAYSDVIRHHRRATRQQPNKTQPSRCPQVAQEHLIQTMAKIKLAKPRLTSIRCSPEGHRRPESSVILEHRQMWRALNAYRLHLFRLASDGAEQMSKNCPELSETVT